MKIIKLYTSILVLSLISSPSYSEVLPSDRVVKREGLFYKVFSTEKFSGEVTGRINGEIVNGLPNGSWKTFHDNGQIEEIGSYEFGKKVGEWKTFFETGQVNTIGTYSDGKLNGKRETYLKDGSKEFESSYLNGQLHGLSITFCGPGCNRNEDIIRRIYNMKYGLKDGLFQEFRYVWDKSTQKTKNVILTQGSYVNDLKQGKWESFTQDGYVDGSIEYVDGMKSGMWLQFFPNGNLEFERPYLDGLEIGEHKFYQDDGKLRFVQRFEDGKLLNTTYYKNSEVDRVVWTEYGIEKLEGSE